MKTRLQVKLRVLFISDLLNYLNDQSDAFGPEECDDQMIAVWFEDKNQLGTLIRRED
jgi:hypothetical protein